MQEQLISFETAKLAKEKGFNEPVQSFWHYFNNGKNPERFDGPYHMIDDALYVYEIEERFKDNSSIVSITKDNDEISTFYLAPTQSLLQKWLREKHNILIIVEPWSDFRNKDEYNLSLGYLYDTICLFKDEDGRVLRDIISSSGGRTYEEALEKALQAGLGFIDSPFRRKNKL